MFVLNGKVLQPGKPFSHKGLQYPGDWLGLATPAQLAEVGIVKRSKTRQYQDFNSKFYWSAGNPRSTEDVKALLKSEQNQILSSRLTPTDWYYVRRAETGEDIPRDVADFRKECRRVKDENFLLIEECDSIENLEELELLPYPEL